MELDINIVINQYKKELMKLYYEKISLQCQVEQLGEDKKVLIETNEKLREKLEEYRKPIEINEVIDNDIH